MSYDSKTLNPPLEETTQMRFKKKQKISLSLCTTYDFSEYDEIKIHSIEVQLNFQELFKSQFGTFLLVASCREQDVLELYIYMYQWL